MEDFNEDDEVWSNPVTDTLKLTDSEQVVRGNVITYIRDINNTMSLLICDKTLSYFQSDDMCEIITSLFSMVIYIFFHYLFTYSYSLFDEGFFFMRQHASVIHYLSICTKLL